MNSMTSLIVSALERGLTRNELTILLCLQYPNHNPTYLRRAIHSTLGRIRRSQGQRPSWQPEPSTTG